MADCECIHTGCPEHHGEVHCENEGIDEVVMLFNGKTKVVCEACAAYLEGIGAIEAEEEEDEDEAEDDEEKEREWEVRFTRTERTYQHTWLTVTAKTMEEAKKLAWEEVYEYPEWETDDWETDYYCLDDINEA